MKTSFKIILIVIGLPFTSFCSMQTQWGLGVRVAGASAVGTYCAHNVATSDRHSAHLGIHSFQAGLFAELFRKNACWELGVLVDVMGDTADKIVRLSTNTAGTPDHVAALKIPFHVGADVRVGRFIIPDGLLYVLIGVEGSKSRFILSNESSVSKRGIAPGCVATNCFSAGLRAGAGISLHMCDCAMLKFEYRFVTSPCKKILLTDAITQEHWSHTLKYSQQSFGLMIDYLF